MMNDMLQGERERRQRFAAAGRRSKRKEARRFFGGTQAVAAKLAAKRIHWSVTGLGLQAVQEDFQRTLHLELGKCSQLCLVYVEVFLGVEKVGVHKATEKHPRAQCFGKPLFLCNSAR